MIDISPQWVVILMIVGMVIGIMLGHYVAFVMIGVATIMAIVVWGPGGTYLFMGRTFHTVTNVVLIAIPLFILMASFLERSRIAEELFEALLYLFGSLNGGLTLAVVILCVVFAATTGIMGATVVSMSIIAMPVLLKRNYSKSLASGTVAASGCLGIIIPPSIMLVMMADQSGISVGRLFAGGLLPGVVLGALFFIYILVTCKIRPDRGPAMPEEERRAISTTQLFKKLIISLVPPLLLIFGVLGSIWLGYATPTEAAGVGAFLAFSLMVIYRRFTWSTFIDCVHSAFRTNAMVMTTLIGATIFTGVFLGLGGGKVVTDLILHFDFMGRWGVFAVMMVITFIMGFFIDWIGIIYITFPIFLPIASAFDFPPLWFIIAMAVNLQMSFLTPPFGYALFYMKSTIPREVSLMHVYKGVMPFIALQIIGLAILVMFPILATFLPDLFF